MRHWVTYFHLLMSGVPKMLYFLFPKNEKKTIFLKHLYSVYNLKKCVPNEWSIRGFIKFLLLIMTFIHNCFIVWSSCTYTNYMFGRQSAGWYTASWQSGQTSIRYCKTSIRYFKISIRYCKKKVSTGCSLNIVFFLKVLWFLNSASSAEMLVFYLPGVCTHTDFKG